VPILIEIELFGKKTVKNCQRKVTKKKSKLQIYHRSHGEKCENKNVKIQKAKKQKCKNIKKLFITIVLTPFFLDRFVPNECHFEAQEFILFRERQILQKPNSPFGCSKFYKTAPNLNFIKLRQI